MPMKTIRRIPLSTVRALWGLVAVVGLVALSGCVADQMPAVRSDHAEAVDSLYSLIYWISVALFVGIVATMLVFVVRFRRRPGVKSVPSGHNTPLEVVWTFTPLLILAVFFYQGFETYMSGVVAPDGAVEIRVRASQWQWEFEYPNGSITMNELTVPQGRAIKLVMSSSDVIHSFFVPEFRVKRDVLPGMYTTLWFEARDAGDAQVYCAEYCGAPHGVEGNAGHSAMLATIKVVSQSEYDEFLQSASGPPEGLTPAQWGEQIVSSSGCLGCHNPAGQPAPAFQGVFGKTETLADGSTVTVDENYVRESILQPQAKVVQGYSPIMQPFRLTDPQIDAVIAYIRSLE